MDLSIKTLGRTALLIFALGAVRAAPLSASSSRNSLTVFDSKNKIVGPAILDRHATTNGGYFNWSVVRKISGIWFVLPVDPAGGFTTTGTILYYTQPDCSGTAYVQMTGPQDLAFSDRDSGGVGIASGSVYYPNGTWPGITLTTEQSAAGTDLSTGNFVCNNTSGSVPNAVPAGILTLPSFTPPFHLR